MYEIESAPLPEVSTEGRGRPRLYPFHDLKRGQCFKVKNGSRNTLSALSCKYGKELGRKFAVRQLDGEVGVWRVK